MKRHITTISLILILVGPAICTFLYLQYQQRQIRHEVKQKMKAGIPKNQLTLLKFSNEEVSEQLEWEHAKEFAFNGQMYDVIEQKITADSSFYWCWWDHKETALNQQLDELVMMALQQDSEQQSQNKILFKLLKLNYLSNNLSPFSFTNSTKMAHHTVYNRHYNNQFSTPPSPPPIIINYSC